MKKLKRILLIITIIMMAFFLFATCRKTKALELTSEYYSVNVKYDSSSTKNGFIAIYNGEPSLGYPFNRAITMVTSTDYLALNAQRTIDGHNSFSLYMNIEGAGETFASYIKPNSALYTVFYIRYDNTYANLKFEIYEVNFDYNHGYNKVLKSSTNLYQSNMFQELYESNTGLTFRIFLSGLVGIWYTDFRENDYQTDFNTALRQIQIGPIVENTEENAYADGRAYGYSLGYDDGYADGEAGETAVSKAVTVIGSVFDVVASVMSIELFPHVPLGIFFLVPLFFAVTGLILWIWRKT